MGLQAKVTKNGLSGDLYLTVITAKHDKFSNETSFLLRGFESRDTLYNHIAGEIDGDIIAYEQEFNINGVDASLPLWPQIYNWLKENHFKDAVDVIE